MLLLTDNRLGRRDRPRLASSSGELANSRGMNATTSRRGGPNHRRARIIRSSICLPVKSAILAASGDDAAVFSPRGWAADSMAGGVCDFYRGPARSAFASANNGDIKSLFARVNV